MDFFAQQDKTRRKTKLLVFYFILAVGHRRRLLYVGLIVFSAAQSHHHHYGEQAAVRPVESATFLRRHRRGARRDFHRQRLQNQWLAGAAARGGIDGRTARRPNTTDPDERKLLNVVEEMAIASGVPVPQVYVLDEEDGINAFAAGHTPSDAAVTVTRGCMKMLSRDELQGVIGHEFSHILNGDMRLNLRLIGIIFGILCIATIGRVLVANGTARRSPRNNPLAALLGLALLLIGLHRRFFWRLIQAAVSRQREFLADASSVQFTRNPGGFPAR
jgi:Zn-dependent protease with chaperone function